MESKQIIHWVIIAAFFMPLVLSTILIWFFITFQKRKHLTEIEKKDMKLREQELIIDKQNAIEKERNRIASEMHDDLGSGLTTIKYLSERALKQAKDPEEEKQVKRIADHSSQLVRNMSEIVWAMNTRYDNLENLLAYIRRYASEYLEEYSLNLEWSQDNFREGLKLSGEKRRNVFLVCKEALHNIIKHAEATDVKITVTGSQEQIRIIITDDGIGFDPESKLEKGNGLFNMSKRMEQIGGKMHINSLDKGTELTLEFTTS